MAKILVVDDETDLETLIKQKFRQKIREQEYQFIFAENGKIALEKLNQNPNVDIVMSDINMPEMDGLTLLSRLNEQCPLIKSIILSAYGDMHNIRAAMNLGAFDFITKPISFDDLEITIQKTMKYVNQIQETLKAVKENNILKMYVDEAVLKFMASREYESSLLANEMLDATVAFIDICSFTAVSEKESPDTVVRLLNNYFDTIVKEIIKQGGYIDKFIGDAIMAVFRGDYHLDRALDACLSVRARISSLPNAYSFNPQVAIGINSGEMVSGNIGSVTLKRLDYTVIGDTVNTAQRLQSVAAPGQIIINEPCFNKISASFHCIKVNEVLLKNKEKAVTIYNVLA